MRLPNWYRVEHNGVRFYRAWNLHATGIVAHGFSTRIGGESSEPCESLNLGLAVQDDTDAVLANRRAFASAIGIDAERIVVPQQVHSGVVRVVTEADAGLGSVDHSSAIPDTDALITNVRNLPLALHFADCTSIFLLDPDNRAIGVSHAGWKGTVAKIVTNTISLMAQEYGTDPARLIAAIGPCVCRSCYDVGQDVAAQLFKVFDGDERVIKQSSTTKWRADLTSANRVLLWQAGVPDANIAVTPECTCCNKDEFFSYRREGRTGRMGGWMSLV